MCKLCNFNINFLKKYMGTTFIIQRFDNKGTISLSNCGIMNGMIYCNSKHACALYI